MKQLKRDLQRLPITIIGFVFLSIGIMLTKRSALGMDPWGVFHEGLSNITGLSFGVITQLIGLVVLIISVWLLKSKIGLGTILNVLLVGWFIDVADDIYQYEPLTYITRAIVFTIGLVTLSFGRSLYIASQLGAGPRDGLFVGLSVKLHIQIKYIKPAIELTVLLLGFLLGGTVGVGTVFAALISGYLVQIFFALLSYDPTKRKQSDVVQYFHQKSSSLK